MDLLCLAKLSAVLALGNGASFLLDLVQGAVDVLAVRRAVTLDAGLAGGERGSGVRPKQVNVGEETGIPGILLVTD